MPKKSWASEEQQTWLLAKLADFRLAQEAKTTPIFFTDLYEKFHVVWPPAPPNTDEISKADGNEEKAKTAKQKASETVSGLFTIIYRLAWHSTHTSDSTNISTTKAEDLLQGRELERH